MKKRNSNKTKEIIIKFSLVLSLISLTTGIIGGLALSVNDYEYALLIGLLVGLGIPIILLIFIFFLASTVKEMEPNSKDYMIKYYNCTLNEEIESRMAILYKSVIHSKYNSKNFYSTYHKQREVVIIAVMYVKTDFCEDEYKKLMNEIPGITERILNHTLIVIFIEEEKSSYLKGIMFTPEYNSLWDTKIFCVYDESTRILKVNKTNSGTGNKAYNDAKKDLDKIFGFVKRDHSAPLS